MKRQDYYYIPELTIIESTLRDYRPSTLYEELAKTLIEREQQESLTQEEIEKDEN